MAESTVLLNEYCALEYIHISQWMLVCVAVSAYWPLGSLSADMIDDLCAVVKVFSMEAKWGLDFMTSSDLLSSM